MICCLLEWVFLRHRSSSQRFFPSRKVTLRILWKPLFRQILHTNRFIFSYSISLWTFPSCLPAAYWAFNNAKGGWIRHNTWIEVLFFYSVHCELNNCSNNLLRISKRNIGLQILHFHSNYCPWAQYNLNGNQKWSYMLFLYRILFCISCFSICTLYEGRVLICTRKLIQSWVLF